MNAEQLRLDQANSKAVAWKRWGPYLSERQWGTVREDYSESGDAWNYFTHDQARSRAYRWGEDGLAGFSDDRQLLCLALALWNGKDPIIKERLFGLSNGEGNHGEDVKEYYFYLDSTPTHSYMKYLYKYPQKAYPYNDLVKTNRERNRNDPEYELLDTGIFDDNSYFDVFVEYAKASAEDILVQITIHNRGAVAAPIHLLPTLWFRNTWSKEPAASRPSLHAGPATAAGSTIESNHPELGRRFLHAEGQPELLFTENETNSDLLVNQPNPTPYVKDGINNYLVRSQKRAVNPAQHGTKAAIHYTLLIEAEQSTTIRLRFNNVAPSLYPSDMTHARVWDNDFDSVMASRRQEADEFFDSIVPVSFDPDSRAVMRQAIAGMLWSKQFYFYDVNLWLAESGRPQFGPRHSAPRNGHWRHMYNADIVSMPDKWEYPWYAAWDLAFHVPALTLVDSHFGKEQLELMLQSHYQHPNGQLPAYEWNFNDVNPPVHAWATVFTYRLDKLRRGKGDIEWLQRIFHKLLMNFTWWVNRKDRTGSNIFEGGFLGLDNIGLFDRSAPLPGGGYLDQADGTAWMAFFCQGMIEIASLLSAELPGYLDMMQKFTEHYLWIAAPMLNPSSGVSMWDEEDGFFYDVLRKPNGECHRLKVRSVVGLLPLCAVTIYEGGQLQKHPQMRASLARFLASHSELTSFIHDSTRPGVGNRIMASILNETNLRRVLAKMLDENEFLSAHGIRSLSRFHAAHPYHFNVENQQFTVDYVPAESNTGVFGGNSNWRGPIWMPINAIIIRALLHYYLYYGDEFKVECPTGSGKFMTLYQVANEIQRRLSSLFLPDKNGARPVNGGNHKFQKDPYWKDLILFYEYFHGDTGAGLGASHQTGWTGIIARIMHLFETTTPQQALELGKDAALIETSRRNPAETALPDKPSIPAKSRRRRRPAPIGRASPSAKS